MTDLEKKTWWLVGVSSLAAGVLIFAAAGTLSYWQGWAYWGVFFACTVWTTWYMARRDPALLAKRMRSGPRAETQKAQKIIQAFAGIPFYGMLLLSALDHRFGWSHVPIPAVAAGLMFTAAGYWIVYLAIRENTFASATIELQPGQRVIATGPYAAVRHPMYSGALLMLLGTPVAMGSWWGLTLFPPITVPIVWRLVLEERFLAKELSGYTDYCRRVRWRLFPGVF